MKISDIAGLSEPLTRLIEVISNGIGAVSKPYLIRKTTEARADEIRIIATAINEVAEKHQLPAVYKDGMVEVWSGPDDKSIDLNEIELNQRILKRIDYQERKRQKNIENITSIAANDHMQSQLLGGKALGLALAGYAEEAEIAFPRLHD